MNPLNFTLICAIPRSKTSGQCLRG